MALFVGNNLYSTRINLDSTLVDVYQPGSVNLDVPGDPPVI